MSITDNTQGLEEVLEMARSLPNAGSGGSSADLVIGLNVANTKHPGNGKYPNFNSFTVGDLSIESGSVSDVASKIAQGIPARVVMEEIHFYGYDLWSKGICEATHVSVCTNSNEYPTDIYDFLQITFYVANLPSTEVIDYRIYPARIKICFDIASGVPTKYICEEMAFRD